MERDERVPDLYFIGAAKAATTSLATVLAGDQDFHVNHGDGSGYEIAFHAGRNEDRDRDWYVAHFAGARPEQRVVDYSTAYSRFPAMDAAPSAARTSPDARLLYLLRDPLERMRSHWRMRIREGTETRPFADAVSSERVYIDLSSYGMQIGRYLEFFPVDALLVVVLEDVAVDTAEAVARIRRHVGLTSSGSIVADPSAMPAANRDEARRTPRVVRRVLSTDVGDRARSMAPAWFRRAIATRVTRTVDYPASQLPGPQETELREHFAEDLATVRPWMPPTWDGWGLLPPGR